MLVVIRPSALEGQEAQDIVLSGGLLTWSPF